MAGMMYEVIDGKRKGCIAAVSNKQESKIVSLGKVHAFFFDEKEKAILEDGKHVNNIISLDKLKQIGFYD